MRAECTDSKAIYNTYVQLMNAIAQAREVADTKTEKSEMNKLVALFRLHASRFEPGYCTGFDQFVNEMARERYEDFGLLLMHVDKYRVKHVRTIVLPAPPIDWFEYLADCQLYTEFVPHRPTLRDIKNYGLRQFEWHAAALKPGMVSGFDWFVRHLCENEVPGQETLRQMALAYKALHPRFYN